MSIVNSGEWIDAGELVDSGERVDPELDRSRANRGIDEYPRMLAWRLLNVVMERIGGTRGLFNTLATSGRIDLMGGIATSCAVEGRAPPCVSGVLRFRVVGQFGLSGLGELSWPRSNSVARSWWVAYWCRYCYVH